VPGAVNTSTDDKDRGAGDAPSGGEGVSHHKDAVASPVSDIGRNLVMKSKAEAAQNAGYLPETSPHDEGAESTKPPPPNVTPRSSRKRTAHQDPWLIDPRNAFMRRWDMLTLVLLAFTAIVTPYEVAYLGKASIKSVLFWINRLVDFIFYVDLVMNFNLIYYSERENIYVTDRRRIVLHYLTGFFIIDAVSVLPFEIVSVAGGSGSLDKFKVLRVVRIFRLAKLLRILRSGRIFRRLENSISVKYGVIQLWKFVVATCLIAHWMACGFHLVVTVEDRSCMQGDGELMDGGCNWVFQYFGDLDRSPGEKYVAALYWSVMTISTVGYGDITPQTVAERMFIVVSMLVGASVYAYVVGSVCGIISSMDQKSTEFYNLMDNLNTFIKEAKLPFMLAQELRSFFRYRRTTNSVEGWLDMLRMMSPNLRGQVAVKLNSDWMNSVSFFSDCPKEMLIELVFVLRSETFPPFEEIIAKGEMGQKMYVVKRGLAASRGRVYTAGKVFGEDMVFDVKRRNYSARSLTFTDLYSIHRDQLMPVLHGYPQVQRKMRRLAIRHIFRRAVVTYARAIRQIREEDSGLSGARQIDKLLGEDDTYALTYNLRLSAAMRANADLKSELDQAATKLQANFRGFQARKEAGEQQTRMEDPVMQRLGRMTNILERDLPIMMDSLSMLSKRMGAVEEKMGLVTPAQTPRD